MFHTLTPARPALSLPHNQAIPDPRPTRPHDPSSSVIGRSAEWRSSGGSTEGSGLSSDERDFLSALAQARTLVTDRARYAEYATASVQGVHLMPIARPSTEVQEARLKTELQVPRPSTALQSNVSRNVSALKQRARPASAAAKPGRWTPSLDVTPEKKEAVDENSPVNSTIASSPVVSVSSFISGRSGGIADENDDPMEALHTEKNQPKENRRRELFTRETEDTVVLDTDVAFDTNSDSNTNSRDIAEWRDSLRGAALRRAASARSSGSDISAYEEPTATGSPGKPGLSSARKEKENTTRVSLDHLSSVRLTRDERSFLAKLARERALVTDRALSAAAAGGGLDTRRAEQTFRASLADPIVAQPPFPPRNEVHHSMAMTSVTSTSNSVRSSVGTSCISKIPTLCAHTRLTLSFIYLSRRVSFSVPSLCDRRRRRGCRGCEK